MQNDLIPDPEPESISKLEEENRFLMNQREKLFKKIYKGEDHSNYFDYIDTDWEAPARLIDLDPKKNSKSLESRLKKILEEESEENDFWKNGTELIEKLKKNLSLKGGFLERNEDEEVFEPRKYWEFRSEKSGDGLWPERYNKMFNYFLLAKDENSKNELITAHEVLL